ncbi:hypothetical protein [Pseudomonas sp. SDO524_S393]
MMLNKEQRGYVRNLFSSCSLNRDYRQVQGHNLNWDRDALRNIVNPDAFESAILEIVSQRSGLCFSEAGLLRIIGKTLLDCEEVLDADVEARVKAFEENLDVWDMREFKIIKTYYGALISDSEIPFNLGPFTVYDIPRHIDCIELDNLTTPEAHFPRNHQRRTVIQYVLTARDEERALHDANLAFNALDLVVAFLLGEEYKDYSLGVLRMPWVPFQRALISQQGGTWSQDEMESTFNKSFELERLESYCAKDGIEGIDGLLEIMIFPEGSLEKKISRAIEWAGEASIEANRSSAFLKAAVALEVLLKSNEEGVINASIMSNIAEQCAVLNGRTTEECLRVEKDVKTFYGVRSKIVHSGSASISKKQLRGALHLVKRTTVNLILLKGRLAINDATKLQEYMRRSKYAYCDLQ